MWKYNYLVPEDHVLIHANYGGARSASNYTSGNMTDINRIQSWIDGSKKNAQGYDQVKRDVDVVIRYINQYKSMQANIIAEYKKLQDESRRRQQGRSGLSDESYVALLNKIWNEMIPNANRINDQMLDKLWNLGTKYHSTKFDF